MTRPFQVGDWVILREPDVAGGFAHGRVLDTWMSNGELRLYVSCIRPNRGYGIPARLCQPYDDESLARPLRRLCAAIAMAAGMAQATWRERHATVSSCVEERLVVQTDYGCPDYMRDMPTRWDLARKGFRSVEEARAYRDASNAEEQARAPRYDADRPWSYRVVVERRTLEVLP